MIKDNLHFMRDIIVSENINDITVHHGDLEYLVFYRTHTLTVSSKPLEDLKVHLIEHHEEVCWDNISTELLISANVSD